MKSGRQLEEPPSLHDLYRDHAPTLFSIALRLMGSQDDAADVVHDVFLRLHEKPPGDGVDDLGRWLRGAAVRRCWMQLRTAGRRREVREVSANDYASPPSWEHGVDLLHLERGIARLPTKLRVVLVLHHVEGYTHAEIGELLDISTAASEKRLSRAVESLRTYLEGP